MKKTITLILLALSFICGYAQNLAITLSSNPSGAGTLTGGGSYTQGQSCTITASAKPNYAFENWTKDGSVVSYLPSYNFTVTESAEYVANFKHINGIVVGGATDQNYYLPTYYYYKYSLTQQIYTASELGGQAGQIASVSFYNTTAYTKTRKLAVYMVATDKTAFESRYDWIAVNNTTDLMFSGTVTFEPNSWTTIYFNTPFFYNGASNIALVVDDNQGTQDYGSSVRFRTYNASGNQAIYATNNATNYNPANPSNYYGTLLTQKNQVILGFAQYNINITASANPSSGGTVSGGIGQHYYGQPVTLTATAKPGYVFSNWTKNGEVVSYLSTYTFPASETAQYVANFEQVEGIAIGNADTTNTYLPTYSRNPYSLTQQIYTAAEMGTTPHEISSVSFFNTGQTKTRRFDIYMVETSKTTFESQTDWIPVSESDKVFSGNVSFASNGWTTINFNKVFNYNGSTNVALVINDNYSWDYGSLLSCRAFNTSGNQSIYAYSVYGSTIDPTDPSNFTGTLLAKKNQVVFGFPNYIYSVTATVSPEGWGTVSGNEGLFYMGQSCTLTATASAGHYFKNWTRNGSSVSSNATYTFTVNGDTELVANFVEPIMIGVTANPEEGGTVSGGGEYGPNQTCTLTATPNEGYVFSRWTRNGSVVSCLPTYTFTVSAAGDYVASFYKVEDAVAIGEPTSSNSYLPTYCYSSNSLTQQIYTADELDLNAGPISSVSFFSTSYSETRNMTVYMVNTTKSSFSSSNDWITVSGANLVYSGTVSVAYYNWTTIYFVAPFYYDGSSNIALIVDDNTENDYYYSTSFRTYNTESTQAIRINGEEDYDPYHPSTYNGTLVSMKNQIVLGFPNYQYNATVIADPEEGGMVTGGGGMYYYGQPISVNAIPNEGYVFNYWTKPHENYGYDVVASCLSPTYLPVNGNIQYKGHFQEMDGLVIGEAKYSNNKLPISQYPHSLTQQIYTADELNNNECEISSVSFFNTGYGYYDDRNFTIYIVNTAKTQFDSDNDWIEVSDEDIVFDGTAYSDGSDWTTVYFDTPFSYDGSSNVALVVRVESDQWAGGMSCRTFDANGNQALYVYDEDYPINLSSATGTLLSKKNQVVFGIASYDYTVSVSASPEEGGTVTGGGGQYYFGQPVPISATPNPGYVFNYWSKIYEEEEEYQYEETASYLSSDIIAVDETNNYVAYFEQKDGIIIGEAAKTNQFLPIPYAYYSMSQQIFTADEMNSDACEISCVSFFNTEYQITRNLDVYLVNTDKTSFNSENDWIAVTEGDLVLSSEVTMEGYGWTTIYFSTPFNYDGSSNVALVINDKTGQWASEIYCRTFDTPNAQAIYICDNSNSIDPYNTSNYTGELLVEKNQVIFGIADYQYQVTASANPPAGGTAIGGGDLYYYGQPIPLAATTNDGYAFSNWTKGNEVVACFPEFNLSVTETAEYVANFKQVDGILVGEPSIATSYLPTNYYSYYALTQQIYTAQQLNVTEPCEISSLSFFNAGNGRTRNLAIYLVHTDKTTFESNTDWIVVDSTDLLFSGNVTFPAKSWATIYFAMPFNYDGSSNVALVVDDNTNSYYHNYGSENFKCRTFNTEDTQVLCVSGSNSNSTNYNPYNPDYSGALQSVKNQVIFGYTHYDYTVTASANPTEGGEVDGDMGTHYYGRPVTLSATANLGYVFNKWTKNNEVASYLSTYNFPVTETAEYVSEFQLMDGIAIGDAVSTNTILPSGSYYYSLSQQIYTSDEMGNEARPISSVSFFNTNGARTRKYAIYMVHTDKLAFESNTDWITVTEADKVFEGNVSFAGSAWTTINFNEIFEYDGLHNVALIVDDNTNSYSSGLGCRVFQTDGYQSIFTSNYGTNFDPLNPTAYNGSRYLEKNQVVFGFPSYNYSVTVSANPIEGGSASGGGEGYHLGQLSTVEATANPGYCFYNWTIDGTVVSIDNPYTFAVTGDMELVANFGTPIAINVTADPSNGGTVTGGGGYGPNHSCTITAVPNPGYVFTKWTKGTSTSYTSYLSSYTFTVTNYSAGDYIAHFEPINNGVAIGDAVSTNSSLPYNYSPFSLSQQIYTAEELNIGQCQISSISLFATNSESTHKITVYMVNTNKTSFESTNDWISVTEADIVYSGYFTPTYGAWTTLYFNTPFSYNGSSNIALIVDDNTGESNNGPYYRSFNTESMQAIRINSYEENYDPNNPTTYTGTLMSLKNQIIFGFASYGCTASVSANPSEGGVVSGGGGYYFYGQNIPVNATPNPGYVFNNWTKNGTVVSYLSSDNVSVTETAEYVANFQQMEGIVVGLPVSTNQYLPTYSYDYGMSQQIYTTAEMGAIAAEISSVSFFNIASSRYRNLDIYMVSTDKVTFADNYDWIPVTEADKVYSGSITVTDNDWTTIYFSTPFEYDGTSNVALVVVDNSNSYNTGLRFRTFETDESQAIYTYSYGESIDPFYPSGYYGTLVQQKNQVVFGTASYDYMTTIAIDPEEGGTVVGGDGPCYYGQPITISVTANPGYVFNNWTKYTVGSYGYGYDEEISYLSTDIVSVTESTEYTAHFQQMDGIIIGEAVHANHYLPSSFQYYTLSQQIFTADEMNSDACDISSVSFFNTEYSGNQTYDIYMVNTDKEAFTGPNDWIAVTEEDLVYSGSISFAGYNWTTVYFSTAFHYDGTSNVVLVVNDKGGQYSSRYCRSFDTQSTQAIYASGSNSYDPYNPSNYNGTLLTEKNQVVFGIASYDYNVTVSTNPTEGGTAIGGGGPYYYGQPIPLSSTANNGYVFSTWTKGNEVVSCFPDFTLNVTETAEYVANFKQVDGILVGEVAQTSSYLPTYYHSSLTQQIYTSAEMGGACQISSVSFFNTGTYSKTRNLDIYMVHTDKTAFESTTDWITVTQADGVLFSGNVTFPAKSWVTIYFANPFNYNGTSNVALIVDDNSNNSNYGDIKCRTFETENTQVLRAYSSSYNSINYDPYNPSGYTGSLLSEKNQVIFGYAHYDYEIFARANPYSGGFVNGVPYYYGSHYYGQPISFVATPKPHYVFNYWTKDDDVSSYYSTYNFSVSENAEYVANFQQTDGIVIGDAVATNSSLPTNAYYYSLSQQIYTATEMGGQSSQVSSVSFFNTGTARTRNLDIYMVHTDKTVFESNSDWITVAESDKVFSGVVDFTVDGWTTIYFSKVFVYDGTSNVVLIVDDNTNNYASNLSCRTFNTEGNQAICVSTYGTNYDPCNPTTFTGTLLSQKNQVIFGHPSYIYSVTASAYPTDGGTVSGGGSGYFLGQPCTLTATETNPNYRFYNWTLDGEVVSYDAIYTFPVTGNMHLVANFGEPISVTVSANPSEGGTVIGGGGYGLNQPCTLTAVANPGYVFTKWTKGTSTSGLSYLSTYTVSVTEAANYVANFKQIDNSIVIGDAVSTNSYLPTYTYSQYSLSQQIYTAAEMGSTAREISSVSFFNTSFSRTRNLTVYMVHTTKTNFANDSDWITVSEDDMVFSGNVSITSQDWVTIYFETPFLYNGTSNIALIIDDNTGSTTSTTNCRTFGTTDNQAIRVYGSNVDYDPSNLTGITGTLHSEKNQVVFGIASYDYYVTTSASPAQGGTVSEGGGPYYLGQPCTVTATPNTGAGYCFYYWRKSNGSVLSYEPTYTFPVMGNTSLTAVFGSPYHITATVGTEGGGTVTGGGDYGQYHTCTLVATPAPGYVFNYWTKNGSVESYYSTYSFSVYNSAEYVAVFELVSPNIAVGEAENSASFPSSSYYYSLSQQIYTADEIGMSGVINSISFFSTNSYDVTRKYTIFMKHTDKTAFGSSYDWVPVSESDQVFKGSVTMTRGGWTEITFDTPFQYNGSSNLVLVVNDTTGTYGYTSCRVFNTGSYQTTYAATNSYSLDPSNASNYYGNRSTSKNQIILGFTPSAITQTITLSAGVNWVSFYVETDLDALKAALESTSNASITIQSKNDGLATYNGIRWRGTLNSLDVTQMYMVTVESDCEIVLGGLPVNPSEHPIIIHNGANWIAFPLSEGMTLTNAFAEIAVNGDVVNSKSNGLATYTNRWRGTLSTLVPGQGYIYNSAVAGDRILTFPTSAK